MFLSTFCCFLGRKTTKASNENEVACWCNAPKLRWVACKFVQPLGAVNDDAGELPTLITSILTKMLTFFKAILRFSKINITFFREKNRYLPSLKFPSKSIENFSPLRVGFGHTWGYGVDVDTIRIAARDDYVANDCRQSATLGEGGAIKTLHYACKKVVVWFEKLGQIFVAEDRKRWPLTNPKAAIPP